MAHTRSFLGHAFSLTLDAERRELRLMQSEILEAKEDCEYINDFVWEVCGVSSIRALFYQFSLNVW